MIICGLCWKSCNERQNQITELVIWKNRMTTVQDSICYTINNHYEKHYISNERFFHNFEEYKRISMSLGNVNAIRIFSSQFVRIRTCF